MHTIISIFTRTGNSNEWISSEIKTQMHTVDYRTELLKNGIWKLNILFSQLGERKRKWHMIGQILRKTCAICFHSLIKYGIRWAEGAMINDSGGIFDKLEKTLRTIFVEDCIKWPVVAAFFREIKCQIYSHTGRN